MTGVATRNLDTVSIADEVIVNRDGSTARMSVSRLAAQVRAEVPGPHYETRAALFADLDWPAQSQGSVWGDATEAYRGLYTKSGASGAGSWARYADLPQTSLTTAQLAAKADTAALTAEVSAREAAISAETTAREAADNLGDIIRLSSITGTANAATGSVQAAQAHIAISGCQRIQSLWPTTNTATNPTLTIGATAYTIKRRDGSALAAGDLIGGAVYDFVLDPDAVNRLRLMGAVAVGDITGLQEALNAEAAARADGDADLLAQLSTTRQGLGASFDVQPLAAAARAGGAYFDLTSGAYDWGIGLVGGVDVAADTVFDAVAFALQVHGSTTQIRYRLWSRPLGAAWLAQGPGDTGDTQHGSTVLMTPAALGINPGGLRGRVVFPLSEVVSIESGRLYIHEIEALDAGGGRLMSAIEYKLVSGLTTDQYRKWRRAGATSSWSNQVTSTTYVYCYELLTDGYAVRPVADHVATTVVDASAAVDGLGVVISGRISADGTLAAIGASLTLDAATGGTVTDEPITLNPAGGAAITYSYLTDRTAHADLRSVVVRDASNLAVLVKGTDYWAIEELGAFSLAATSGTPRNVLISYVWSRMRYDLIHYSPATGVIAVTKGAERERDQAEFVPDTPVGAIPLYHVHVRSGGNIAVPVWDVVEGVRRSRRAEADEEIARNRRLLRPVMRKLRSGAPFKIVSYGDSNFAQMGGPYSLAAVRSTANTIYHDRTKDATAGLLQSPAYGADVLATIPTYDTGDGAGAVHTKFGLVWELIRALESGYASAISYENRSIPGTNSTNATYHGLDATRLAAATGAGADIAIIGFGQNELGQSYTRANVMAICAAFLAAGTIPIVMGCFRPHAADFHASHTVANWRTTQRQLREAALAAGVPHVSMLTLYAEGETGPLGLSPYDLCAGTKDVHPGIREHRIIGARLALSLLD